MDEVRPFYAGFMTLMVLVLVQITCRAEDKYTNSTCVPSSCGNIRNISTPFRLIGDPENCGDKRYSLSCENNITVLYLFSRNYYVQEINYTFYTIRLAYADIQRDNCSSIPSYSLTSSDLINSDLFSTEYFRKVNLFGGKRLLVSTIELTKPIIYLKCANPVSSHLYVNTAPCINATNTSSSSLKHSYVLIGDSTALQLRASCQIEQMLVISNKTEMFDGGNNMSYANVHNHLLHGFELSWLKVRETQNVEFCYLDNSNPVQCVSFCGYSAGVDEFKRCGFIKAIIGYIRIYYIPGLILIGLYIAARFLLGILCTMLLLIYKWRRRHLSMYNIIEDFLQNNSNLMPIRYSYSDIKKMTRCFADKLGKGGYGSVFKGKLRSGRFVGIKMLEKSNTNGQEFISEVATIGRIHHVNVVKLIGFCAEGSKRALVYEFMPNGSLDKYKFSEEGNAGLRYEQMFEISLGVARGIDYLHQGCNMQILHFDIKPHNILLDENFKPKVSDFGLAKLYPVENSIVSLTAVRGTIGYMAPELFYKNIGGVSYKADVYSFGMLLMEITGKRRNYNTPAENSSTEMYFPDWVYDQVEENYLESEISTEKEMKLLKKMIIVGLWCIQMRPSDRPSMHKVIEMLEGEVDGLQLPPKPFLLPQETEVEDFRDTTATAWSSVLSGDSIESVRFKSTTNDI